MANPSKSVINPIKLDENTEIKVFRTFHEQHGVVEVFIPSECSQTNKWEESRFYFRMNKSSFPQDTRTLFQLEPLSDNGQKFSSVVTLSENHTVTKKLVHSRHLYFNSTRDACNCKLDMFFYARTLLEETFMDELAAASITRQFFGGSFDAEFSSYRVFITALHETDFQSRFFNSYFATSIEMIHKCGERMIQQNDWSSDQTFIDVSMLNLTHNTADEVGHSRTECQNIAQEADDTFDELIRFTRQSFEFVALATFPFDSDSIFLFHRGGFWRVSTDRFRVSFLLEFCKFRVGIVVDEMEIVCIKRYWNGRQEYGVRLADLDGTDSEDYDVVSRQELNL